MERALQWMQAAGLTLILGCLIASNAWSYERLSDTGFFDYLEDYERHQFVGTDFFLTYRWLTRGVFAPYSPQYPLWSDGAQKRRWIYLPRRTRIDTSNPDDWHFPIGTKIWKEFSFLESGERMRVETRLLEKVDEDDWLMETYLWNADQSDATLASAEGVSDYYALGGGKFYDIPSHHECEYCHSKAGLGIGPERTPVLGFSALQLSNERDPNAIHGEMLEPGMVTLAHLQRLGLATHSMEIMPAIPESDIAPLQRRVFGYLHGNCAHCHNQAGMSEFTTTLSFFQPAGATHIQQNGTYQTALAKQITPYLNPPNSPDWLIKPGSAAASAVLYRLTNEIDRYTFTVPQWHHSAGFSVDVGVKMPFTGTNVIDQSAVDAITEYIDNMDTR